MKTATYDLGGFKVTLQRYPTSRRVVPSQNQRELLVAQELSDLAMGILKDHAAAKARASAPKVFGFGCEHTDDEIRAMAHEVHVREQARLIKEAVRDDPAFFGDDEPRSVGGIAIELLDKAKERRGVFDNIRIKPDILGMW